MFTVLKIIGHGKYKNRNKSLRTNYLYTLSHTLEAGTFTHLSNRPVRKVKQNTISPYPLQLRVTRL